MRVDKEKVGRLLKNGLSWAAFAAITVLPRLPQLKNVSDEIRYDYGSVKYSDVINAILNSNIYSGNKAEMVAIVPKDADKDTYKSIIRVVKSNMYAGDKVEIIKDICGVKEEA